MPWKFNPFTGNLDYYESAGVAANGLPAGGTSGQILEKNSTADYDAIWADPAGGGTAKESHVALVLSATTVSF